MITASSFQELCLVLTLDQLRWRRDPGFAFSFLDLRDPLGQIKNQKSFKEAKGRVKLDLSASEALIF